VEAKGFVVQTFSGDPHWPTAYEWFGRKLESKRTQLGVLGVPLAKGSITPGACDLAPEKLRSMLRKFSTFDAALGGDLSEIAVHDFGDLSVADSSPIDASELITERVYDAIKTSDALVILGGDNSVTRPAFLGLKREYSECALLTLDAHLDLRDLDVGPTNGNPIRGLLHDGLPGTNIVQIGIQSFANSMYYMDVARKAGITVIGIDLVRSRGIESVVREALAVLEGRSRAIYVDFDIDVLDRVFAPACPGSRPGGLFPSELFHAARLCGMSPKVAAIDIVEVDPSQDIADVTVMNALTCLLSFAAGVRARDTE
jgi:formiminoglutamase